MEETETNAEEAINTQAEYDNYMILKTRSALHERESKNINLTPTKKAKSSPSRRGKSFFLCQHHYIENQCKWTWVNQLSDDCPNCIKYGFRESLPNGILPTGKEVLELLLTMKSENWGKHINCSYECGIAVVLQWIYCSVYPKSIGAVTHIIDTMFTTFTKLRKNISRPKIGDTHWSDYGHFCQTQTTMMDIKGSYASTKRQEILWGIKMTEAENTFYSNQKLNPRVGYCSSYTDRKWKLSDERKRKRQHRSRDEYAHFEKGKVDTSSDEDTEEVDAGDVYTPGPCDEKTKKYDYETLISEKDDPLPFEFRFPRNGLRSVRPEVYTLMSYLSSSLHMSEDQVEGAIVATANMLFGRKWKVYSNSKEQYGTDNTTLPCMRNARTTERYIEAMALNEIVEEIMKEESTSCVVYSNDGSSQSVTGSYMVQSLTVNGIQRSMPTFGIFSESKNNLKDLQIATLELLSASTGFKYSSKDILQKISFTMTDSTAHNIGVMDMVCADLDVEVIPGQILCNIHPLMMVQGKMKQLFQQIHDDIGKKKIKDCFLVDVEFNSESFVIKALKCFSNFINREYSGKPWNRSQHFSDFIKPKENMSISLKDHRFNRLNDCALSVLYHLDDIASYLETFTTVTNGIAILDRGFLDIEILKPIFTATALIGIHLCRPFQVLLMDKDTVYSTLLEAFPKIHGDLLSISPNDLLTTKQVLFFVSEETFAKSLPKPILLESLEAHINAYGDEIAVLLKILMKMIADGFDHQRGAIFGFGKNAMKDTAENVVKICDMSEDQLKILDANVQVHNLGEERNVGLVNYELSIRGKNNLESVSRKIVLNRAEDLIQDTSKSYKKFKKEAKHIQEIKVKWSEKMKALEKEGFQAKDALNVKKDASKLKDLEFLKQQQIPGPFTAVEDIKTFIESDIEDKIKQDRLYVEVRYAKATCLSMNTQTANRFFKLRENGKKMAYQVYSDCLLKYLDSSKAVAKVSITDFRDTLGNIQKKVFDDENNPQMQSLKIGEHVIVFWVEAGGRQWYLGLVDHIYEDGSISVNHFVPATRSNKLTWTFPDEPDIQIVEMEQLLKSNVTASYLHSTRIRCCIDQNTVDEVESQMKHITLG